MKTSKQKLKILFVMDPMKKIENDDTSVSLMVETQKQGHAVFYAEPKDLYLTLQGLFVNARRVLASPLPSFQILSTAEMAVRQFHAVWIRKEPPVDVAFVAMLHLLQTEEKYVFMINRPSGILQANEKLLGFQFKAWMPPSIASAQEDPILKFQDKLKADVILKPLNLKGGAGIYLLPFSSKNKKSIVQKSTRGGTATVLAQKFIQKGLTEGDKRILLLNGEILGAFRRIPKYGEFRANMSFGGSAYPATITPQEHRMVRAMKPTLLKLGLTFVGLDVIDNFITEINVTSPAGIPEINRFNHVHLERVVIEWFERK
jgi:glutathione synthase